MHVHPDTERTRSGGSEAGLGGLRNRPWFAPAAAAVAAVAALAYVAAVDPNEPGHYPGCPLQATTGLDCPGCGGLRCVHALVRGDIAAAADQNLLALLALPLLVLGWGYWLLRSLGRISAVAWPRWSVPAAMIFLLVFSIVRNIPAVPFLGSGVG